MKIAIVNGPNMNLLGLREPEIYGRKTYDDLVEFIKTSCKDDELDFFQSNHEGEIIDYLQNCMGIYDGVVINPAAYTHTSVAIADCIRAYGIPTIEVHISDPDLREDYRRISYVRDAVIATVKGKGFDGYIEAIKILHEKVK